MNRNSYDPVSKSPAAAGILACIACSLLLLTACAGPRLLSSDAKHRPGLPAKRPPAGTVMDPTLRPYVINGRTYYPLPSAEGFVETGIASWYGGKFHGRKTACGETYNKYDLTAAHRTLPMHTRLLVTNLENGRQVVVRINDRGPFARGRIIDLSRSAAEKLGILRKGTARVRLTALGETRTFRQASGTVQRFLPHRDFNSGEFFVQIGSFRERDNAVRLKDKMLGWGRKPVIVIYKDGERTYYRVQIRAGVRLDHARRSARILAEAGYPGFVVAR